MAIGKSPRIERLSASLTCSTITLVLFVALCLVGVGMFTSTLLPIVLSPQGTNTSEFKKQVFQTASRPLEDGSGNAFSGEINAEDQKDGQHEITEEYVEGNENNAEFNTTDNKSHRDMNTQMLGSRMDFTDNARDENKRSDGRSSEQGENNGVQNVNDHLHTDDDGAKTYFNITDHAATDELFPEGAQPELLNGTHTQNVARRTQAAESRNEKDLQASSLNGDIHSWNICNVNAGADYIPCLDNEEAITRLPTTKHYEHRERHCPEKAPICLVLLPNEYRRPIKWPNSRDKIWYYNVPHMKLVEAKRHQNWVKISGEFLTFPGGGTQFKFGAAYYIDVIQKSVREISLGKHTRVILDVGCGVASFGGYLFDRDVLTMSFAPKDEHEAQVQFALERGIPAILEVMGTKRLPFPSMVFDSIHCARCRVPWHTEGGILLLELNRLLRPGGFFLWSATPVYRKTKEDIGIWKAMSELTKAMCWEMVSKTTDTVNKVGLVIYRKPSNNECYEQRVENTPPLCQESDDPNASWNVSLQACMHRLPVAPVLRGFRWPAQWPSRLGKTPYWLDKAQVGVYGKPAPEDFHLDYENWKLVVNISYLNGIGIYWLAVRNVMDMRSVYGGFAAALRDLKVWVMNVVTIDSADTLPIIYERGLFGIYHDWCQSFSTYPRTYDLLHADHLFSMLKRRCELLPVIVEVDRILRPEGNLIVRDDPQTISEIKHLFEIASMGH